MANRHRVDRREFLKQFSAAAIAAGIGVKPAFASKRTKSLAFKGKKIIIIGMDGMDPVLCENLMDAGHQPNFAKLRSMGGYSRLGTTIPPQSPVAWASFINGAGPGSHGIFDFIHRNPEKQVTPFFSAAETVSGEGYLEIGDHRIQLDFWPFGHKPPATVLRRKGVPFWDYLDRAGISSVFYNIPANYPPSPSKYGNHRCLSGMGTPDMLGTYGTYQYYSEDGPYQAKKEGGGQRSRITFENETSRPGLKLQGPKNTFLKEPAATEIEFTVHRDKWVKAAAIEIQGHRILLKEGEWSRWLKLEFDMNMPAFMLDKKMSGICRFYLQEVKPVFRLYASPVNIDPSDPAMPVTEPPGFIKDISKDLGLFYTTGFQEDHKALSNRVFTDAEFAVQSDYVFKERMNLLEYALKHYDDGLLFFYFSSTDLQAHMFWWDSDEKHPVRSNAEAKKYFKRLKDIYRQMDSVVGNILKRYGKEAMVIVMSDHGFANFKRQFNLNSWLLEKGYIQSAGTTSILYDVDWLKTRAYGLGLNGLYLNLRGRERNGIVNPGKEREDLLNELTAGLEAVRDIDGKQVVRKVHRTDKAYSGHKTKLAPDLIVGYSRGFRASWATILGSITKDVLQDNNSAWSADHCADFSEVPGVIFSNRPIASSRPSIIDIASSIMNEFGLKIPSSMDGRNIFIT